MPVEGVPQRDVLVTFTKHYLSYSPGEAAYFHEEEAQALAERGVADAGAPPPVNVTVPHITQAGATLACTMGEWTGEPTSYAYQWNIGGTDVGDGSNTHEVTAADVGATATCTVTATNDAGSAAAPPDSHVITDIGAASGQGHHRHRSHHRQE